jgi:hypothetical protein
MMFPRPKAARPLLIAVLMLLLVACDEPVPVDPPDNGGGGGGGGGTLSITSTNPADGATTANFSAPVIATVSRAVRGASVTVTSATLVAQPGGADVPRTVVVARGGTSIETSAALLPGTQYVATLGGSIQATTGSTLGTPVTWTFTTRPFASFALDSGRTGYAGDLGLARDNTGALHAVYADSVQGDLFYATCAALCTAAAGWTLVALDTAGNIGSSSAIAVDVSRRVHIVYRDDQRQRFRYATCAAPCTGRASFSFATVDPSSIGVGTSPAIAVDSTGTVHTVYYDFIGTYLRYSRCSAADCAVDANWVSGTVDFGPFVGRTSAIAAAAAGTLHLAYADSANGRLRYAVCSLNCTGVGAWALSDITLGERGQEPAIAVAGNGTLSVSYYAAATDDLGFAECPQQCTLSTNWAVVPLATEGLVGRGSALSVDSRNRLQLIYSEDNGTALRYGTCVNGCTTASRWRFSDVQVNAGIVRSPVAVVRPDRSLQVAYLAWGGRAVRFAE